MIMYYVTFKKKIYSTLYHGLLAVSCWQESVTVYNLPDLFIAKLISQMIQRKRIPDFKRYFIITVI